MTWTEEIAKGVVLLCSTDLSLLRRRAGTLHRHTYMSLLRALNSSLSFSTLFSFFHLDDKVREADVS
jgi:hypothetical protein